MTFTFRTAALLLLVALAVLAALAPRALAVAPADFYGMDAFNQLGSDSEAAEMQRLGIHNVHLNMVWREFQQSNCNDGGITGINFSSYDQKVLRAAEHNITIIADLYGSRLPSKSECANGADLHYMPYPGTQLYKDFTFKEGGGYKGGFVWQVVQRYGQNGSFWYEHPNVTPHPIKIWEVWNEPNLPENNPYGNGVQPQAYAKLLIDTSSAIRKAQEVLIGQNPYNIGTRVLFGGLWGDSQYAQGGEVQWKLEKYLKAIYNEPAFGYTAAEAHSAFDGLSYHPYALHGTATDAENTIGGARAVLNGLGDTNKTLWLTEIGWPVDFNQISPSHNAQEQSELLSSTLSWAYANREYLKAEYAATFVYQNLSNPCTSVSCWAEYSGIRDVNGTKRPAWCAIANLIGSNPCEFTAFQANTGSMFTYAPSVGGADTASGMAAGTSPSVALLPTGYLMAFQSWQGELWTYSPATKWTDLKVAMRAETSPAIAALPDGSYVVAFQGSDGRLWTYSPKTGAVPHELGMRAETSPSVAALPDGSYVVAFQSWQGELWTYASTTGSGTPHNLGLAGDTTPSIVVMPNGSYTIAFQSWQGSLWTYSSQTGIANNRELGMREKTSASIVAMPDGSYVVAFQSWQGELWTYTSATGIAAKRNLGMAPISTPNIAAVSGSNYMIAFQSWQGGLWTYSSATGGGTNRELGMKAGTSPGVAPG